MAQTRASRAPRPTRDACRGPSVPRSQNQNDPKEICASKSYLWIRNDRNMTGGTFVLAPDKGPAHSNAHANARTTGQDFTGQACDGKKSSGSSSRDLRAREAEHGEDADEVRHCADQHLEAQNLLWELCDEEDGMRKARRAVDVEGRCAPGGRVAAYGDCGRDCEEPRFVFLGVVDELDKFLRACVNGGRG